MLKLIIIRMDGKIYRAGTVFNWWASSKLGPGCTIEDHHKALDNIPGYLPLKTALFINRIGVIWLVKCIKSKFLSF